MRPKIGISLLPTLLATTGALAFSVPAMAQDREAQANGEILADDAPPEQSAQAAESEAIVVTGSRITRDGYQAPTPVTVALTDELLKAAPTGIPEGLNRLPQFVGSSGPNRQGNIFGTPNHGNLLNLRGLGANRTLILLDGLRVPPTTYLGTVDVDIFPHLLVERVDIVTAGASSAYGSDAVAGVVNFVLDTDFTGLKGVAQSGVSSRGDNANYRIGVAGGMDLGSRAHVLFSLDHSDSDGYLFRDRPELTDRGLAVGRTVGGGRAGTAANPYIFVEDLRLSLATFGGLATSGPFANTNFVTPGTYRPVVTGTPTGSPGVFVGGDYYFGPDSQQASAAVQNNSGMGRLSYDLADTVTAYVQVIGAESKIGYNSLPNLLLTPPIFSGNAFLPAALQAQLTAANVASFNFGKSMIEMGPIESRERLRNVHLTAGLGGGLGDFEWSVSYVFGRATHRFAQSNNFEQTKLAAALDAVRDPVTGNIVCRPTLSADPTVRARYADCVPFNPFGLGAASDAARAYVVGESRYFAKNTTNDFTATISGEVFELPAGAVSVALGAEYRDQKLSLVSNADPAVRLDLTGLRGLAANATRFYLSNTASAAGKLNVKEGFVEVSVPVLADLPFARSLDLNGAFRYTDYSTSGGVSTWKIGGTWQPIDDLRFRITRSRDIRAPTLFDLFAGSQIQQAAVLDPHTNISSTTFQRTSGNPNLVPEVGNTLSAGLVYQPSYLPGFSIAIDAYDVKITGAIATLSALQALTDCEDSGGTAPSCANIIRPLPFSDRSPANYPTEISVSGVNIASIETRGIDLDATYRRSLGNGELGLRIFATYVDRFRTQLSANQPLIEYAGFSAAGSGGVAAAIPRFKGAFSVNYSLGDFSLFVQENVIGKIKLGPTSVYDEPSLPAWFTTDLTLSYNLDVSGHDGEFFLSATNLLNDTPPKFYGTTAPGIGLSTIVGLYDTTGTQLTAGIRFDW